jgi:hypothetical protein
MESSQVSWAMSIDLFMTFMFSYHATDLFQPKWMKEEKMTYWLYLVQHAMMDGLIMYMLTHSFLFFFVISITHYFIDRWQLHNRNRIPDRIAHVIVWGILSCL